MLFTSLHSEESLSEDTHKKSRYLGMDVSDHASQLREAFEYFREEDELRHIQSVIDVYGLTPSLLALINTNNSFNRQIPALEGVNVYTEDFISNEGLKEKIQEIFTKLKNYKLEKFQYLSTSAHAKMHGEALHADDVIRTFYKDWTEYFFKDYKISDGKLKYTYIKDDGKLDKPIKIQGFPDFVKIIKASPGLLSRATAVALPTKRDQLPGYITSVRAAVKPFLDASGYQLLDSGETKPLTGKDAPILAKHLGKATDERGISLFDLGYTNTQKVEGVLKLLSTPVFAVDLVNAMYKAKLAIEKKQNAATEAEEKAALNRAGFVLSKLTNAILSFNTKLYNDVAYMFAEDTFAKALVPKDPSSLFPKK